MQTDDHAMRSRGLPRRGSILLRKCREVGLVYLSQLVLRRLIPTFVFNANKLFVFASDIRSLEEYRTSDPEIRWAGPADIDKVGATGESVASARKRFEDGARLAVVERGGRIVAYRWCQVGVFDHDDWLRFKLSPTDVWTMYAWVTPELRGQGLNARVKKFAYAAFVRIGYKQGLSVIDALNRNSIGASAKTLGRPIGCIWFIRIFGFTLVGIDNSVRIGWWGLGRRLDLLLCEFGGY